MSHVDFRLLSFRDVMHLRTRRFELDIADIRKLFGNQYDDGIAVMLKYARSLPEFQ